MQIDEELIVERFQKAAEVFAKAFNAMRDFINSKWETINEYVMNYESMYKKPIHQASKARVISRHSIGSQVMDCKPRFIRARTTC